MSEDIIVERGGGILRVTINRPDAGNAMTDAMALEFTGLVNARRRPRAWCCCAAPAMISASAAPGQPRPPTQPEALERRRSSDVVFNTYGAIRDCPMPVVCVVQGRALGFGCAVAAVADITIASDNADLPGARDAAQHPAHHGDVGARSTGRSRKALAYLVYSTKAVSAERALIYGIVSDVVPRSRTRGGGQGAVREHPPGAAVAT